MRAKYNAQTSAAATTSSGSAESSCSDTRSLSRRGTPRIRGEVERRTANAHPAALCVYIVCDNSHHRDACCDLGVKLEGIVRRRGQAGRVPEAHTRFHHPVKERRVSEVRARGGRGEDGFRQARGGGHSAHRQRWGAILWLRRGLECCPASSSGVLAHVCRKCVLREKELRR